MKLPETYFIRYFGSEILFSVA